eukprot:11261321-Karenia_brevis.AAC.1
MEFSRRSSQGSSSFPSFSTRNQKDKAAILTAGADKHSGSFHDGVRCVNGTAIPGFVYSGI